MMQPGRGPPARTGWRQITSLQGLQEQRIIASYFGHAALLFPLCFQKLPLRSAGKNYLECHSDFLTATATICGGKSASDGHPLILFPQQLRSLCPSEHSSSHVPFYVSLHVYLKPTPATLPRRAWKGRQTAI